MLTLRPAIYLQKEGASFALQKDVSRELWTFGQNAQLI